VIPSAYQDEWDYLREESKLWRPWRGTTQIEAEKLNEDLQDGQVLIQCLGYKDCQRDFRTITCRAFPFYPYLTSSEEFIALAYYQDFRKECWIINNLGVVSLQYKQEFHTVYKRLFDLFPETKTAYLDFSSFMRQNSANNKEDLVALGFAGELFLIDPTTEEVRSGQYSELEAYGPFKIAREMSFPDEIDDLSGRQKHG
jgi:hypothetical protein